MGSDIFTQIKQQKMEEFDDKVRRVFPYGVPSTPEAAKILNELVDTCFGVKITFSGETRSGAFEKTYFLQKGFVFDPEPSLLSTFVTIKQGTNL